MTKEYTPNLNSDPRLDSFKQMVDTSRLIRTYIDMRARTIGTTRAQWALLARLARQPGLTQSELADMLEIQPISLTRLVDRLADQGLVVREPHPTDRRANCVFITENGLLAMEAFSPLAQEITEELFEGVAEADLIAFNTVVETIKANVKSYMSDHRDGIVGIDAEIKVS
jgi:DNA-binding MarR family transcriptional regulator